MSKFLTAILNDKPGLATAPASQKTTTQESQLATTQESELTTDSDTQHATREASSVPPASTLPTTPKRQLVQKKTASPKPKRVDSAPIFGNCGTLIAFRASGADAEILSKEMATNILAPGFQNIPDYHCRVTTLQNKQPTAVQYVSVLPPLPKYDSVREASLRRWGNPRGKVEARIKRHLN